MADMMACLDSGYVASKRSPTGSKARTRMHAHTQRGEHTTHVSRIHAPRPPAAAPRWPPKGSRNIAEDSALARSLTDRSVVVWRQPNACKESRVQVNAVCSR